MLKFVYFILFIFFFELLQKKIPYQQYKNNYLINIVLVSINFVIVKLFTPFLYYTQTHNTGLLQYLPSWSQLILTILIFDLTIYWQHRAFHYFDFLWRFHSIHHGDRNLSTLSGVRFHPIEISLSLVYKYLLLIILSPSIEYYLLYEIILTSMALFNHSNINLNFDKTLSKIIVTPKFHFIHHDQRSFMTNSNYGNFLSIWDRLFSTFENGAIKNLGTPQVSEKQSTSIKYNLISPFIKSETKHESA